MLRRVIFKPTPSYSQLLHSSSSASALSTPQEETSNKKQLAQRKLFSRTSSLIEDVPEKKEKEKDQKKFDFRLKRFSSSDNLGKLRSNSVRSYGGSAPLPILQSKVLNKLEDIHAFK